MKKPDFKKAKKLILEAPIGGYIGEHGAEILARHACCECKMQDNEYLFHQGDMEVSFYILTKGRLAIVKERKKGKNPCILHVFETGDLVGELSFIDDTPHTTSVMALSGASLLQFKAQDIKPLILEQPQLMFDFMRAVIKRVHHMAAAIAKQQMALSDYISSGGRGRL